MYLWWLLGNLTPTLYSVIKSLRKQTRRGSLRLEFSLWECLKLHWFVLWKKCSCMGSQLETQTLSHTQAVTHSVHGQEEREWERWNSVFFLLHQQFPVRSSLTNKGFMHPHSDFKKQDNINAERVFVHKMSSAKKRWKIQTYHFWNKTHGTSRPWPQPDQTNLIYSTTRETETQKWNFSHCWFHPALLRHILLVSGGYSQNHD